MDMLDRSLRSFVGAVYEVLGSVVANLVSWPGSLRLKPKSGSGSDSTKP
jgi:hypothetical protein